MNAVLLVLAAAVLAPQQTADQFRVRDPFILPVRDEGVYYLFSTGLSSYDWGRGFPVYKSRDLVNWEGPEPAFRPPDDFHSVNLWAPEVYAYRGKYYMFATLKPEGKPRGTHVLVADKPVGPYKMRSETPVTPSGWYCLDGTFYLDEQKRPWMVFCHEWVQTGDGEMCAVRLSPELDATVGEPVLLFRASDVAWVSEEEAVRAVLDAERYGPEVKPGEQRKSLVTDGPFLHQTAGGRLIMLWSTFGKGGYRIVTARSASGEIEGPWIQNPEPLFSNDGGHAMLFHDFDGDLMMAFHRPNRHPDERLKIVAVKEQAETLVIAHPAP